MVHAPDVHVLQKVAVLLIMSWGASMCSAQQYMQVQTLRADTTVADAVKLSSRTFERREICLRPNVRLTRTKVEMDDTEFRIRIVVWPVLHDQGASQMACYPHHIERPIYAHVIFHSE